MNAKRKVALFLVLGVGALGTPPARPQNTGRDSDVSTFNQSPEKGKLQFTTSITTREYCNGLSSPHLRLHLKLKFTNVGTVPVLLDKKSSVIPRTLISRNFKAAAAKKYVADTTYHYFTYKDAGVRMSFPDESFFVLLKPDESYIIERERVGVLLYDGTKDTEDELRPGNYVLQLKVWTWYYPMPAASYRELWRDKGYLWAETITSEPMPFTVVKQKPLLKPCSAD